jgi:hypothetical protein
MPNVYDENVQNDILVMISPTRIKSDTKLNSNSHLLLIIGGGKYREDSTKDSVFDPGF